jgi:RimJ/RimL family protein N-acetyltransferase
MEKFKSFETERLLLKPTSVEDASFIVELVNSPKWIQYIGERNVRTEGEAKQYILEKMTPQLEKMGFANYTVVRKLDGVKMGTCGLYDREGLEGVDIGFAFLPEFENKGYGYESANKIKLVGFSQFGLKKIHAITTKENLASQKLIEKLGMTFKKFIKIPNDDEELMLYEIDNF